uniref:Calcium homeostasis modulator family member 5 n=1 Tax=Sinocyclocheilus anshuiensis TaxID=1608454 RepID=A0A671K5R0_9TELE
MDSFKTVLKFLTNQKTTIGYSFMAILTIGSERIFSMVSFQCPCNHQQNFAYGLTFLLGPAVVLLAIGLFVSTRLWRLYTGCCLNPLKLCPRGNFVGCLQVFVKVLSGACIAPVMWLSVALLNGTFYECAVSGLDENVVVHCLQKTMLPNWQRETSRVSLTTKVPNNFPFQITRPGRRSLLYTLLSKANSTTAHCRDTWSALIGITALRSDLFWRGKMA